jgi:hypothetical protein
VFTARYALSPYIKQTRFVFKGLIIHDAKRILTSNFQPVESKTLRLCVTIRYLYFCFNHPACKSHVLRHSTRTLHHLRSVCLCSTTRIYFVNDTISEKKKYLTWILCLDFLSKFHQQLFSFQEGFSAMLSHSFLRLHVKCLIFLPDFNQTWTSRQILINASRISL